MAEQTQESSDKNVEMWKIKKLIKSLEAARGNGTSMISLIIPPRDQIPRIAKMLADEYGTASNIKSRVNRLSVLSAITSVQARLKLYSKGSSCSPLQIDALRFFKIIFHRNECFPLRLLLTEKPRRKTFLFVRKF